MPANAIQELARCRLEQTRQPETPNGRSPDQHASSDVDTGEKPDWLDSGACATAFSSRPGDDGATDLETAREALESASRVTSPSDALTSIQTTVRAIGASGYPWRYKPHVDFVVLEDPDRNLFWVFRLLLDAADSRGWL